MKPCISVLLAGLIVAAFAAPVTALPSGAVPESEPGAYPLDCAKWKDKARCANLNQKIQACRSKTDDEWRECMYGSASTAKFTAPTPRDCSTARDKVFCEAHAGALRACKDKHTRAEHRKCVAEQLQAASLTKH